MDTSCLERKQSYREKCLPEIAAERSCTCIDTHMLPAKIAYIFKLALYDRLLFSMLFYLSIGLTPIQGGLVNGLQHIGGLLGAPIIGLMADKTKKYRPIALACCFLAVVTNTIQPVLSFLYRDDVKDLFCILLPIAIAASALETSAISFVDSGVLQRMRSSTQKPSYSLQRMFGCIGQAAGSISNSLAVKYFPRGIVSPYTGVYITYAVFGLSLMVTTYFLLDAVDDKVDTDAIPRDSLGSSLFRAVTTKNIIFFLNALVNGSMQALLFSFTYVYMKEFKAPTLVFGLGMTFAAMSAFITYLISPWLIQKLGGPEKAFCISWLCMGIRFFITAYLCKRNPYLLIVPELLQGPTYSLFWVSSIEHIVRTSEASIWTSMCGLFNGLFNPCSFLVANILGAKLYENVGGEFLFICSGNFCFLWAAMSSLYFMIKDELFWS